MQYWAYINGEQKGPMDLDQLLALNITHETLVWREGLETWIPAKELSELSTIMITPVTAEIVPPPIASTIAYHQETTQQEPQPKAQETAYSAGPTPAYPRYAPGQQPYQEYRMPPCPPTNLVWAILSLVCCCQIFGIVAVVYAAQVTSLYNTGKYEASLKASNNAMMWSIISLATGIVGGIIYTGFTMWSTIFGFI